MKRFLTVTALSLCLATPAFAGQWWTINLSPLQCEVSLYSPAEASRSMDNGGSIKEYTKDIINVSGSANGIKLNVAFFRTKEVCEAMVEAIKKDQSKYE